jgi:2-polyprenyl-6-methoxyphenol hydroxylase-like FAD-dependent oxidoreductase
MEFILGLGKNGSIWPTQGDRIMWYLPVKMPLAAFAKEEGEAQAIKICEGWHPDVMRVVTAPQTAQRFHVPIYEVDPSPINSKGRTVLIGDAACTFGPLLGQGVNKAIEDAFVLAELISQSTLSVPVLLQQYQAMRSERHERFFELEQLSADALMHDDEESLAVFEEALPSITLAMMYQDVIPLVNQKAFSQLYEKIEKAAKSDAKMSEKARQVAMRD